MFADTAAEKATVAHRPRSLRQSKPRFREKLHEANVSHRADHRPHTIGDSLQRSGTEAGAKVLLLGELT